MVTNIQIQGKKAKKYRGLISKAAEETLLFTGKKGKALSVLVGSERQIREFNRRFRKADYPTDVLSFPYGEKHSPYLGDIAISFTQAKEQAREYKEKLEDELSRLVIHGVLHLLGETDYTRKSKKKMWAKQEKIWAGLKEARQKNSFYGGKSKWKKKTT